MGMASRTGSYRSALVADGYAGLVFRLSGSSHEPDAHGNDGAGVHRRAHGARNDGGKAKNARQRGKNGMASGGGSTLLRGGSAL